MSKLEKEIKKFFDFIFKEDIYVEDAGNGIYNVDFKNLVAKRDAVLNMARIKRILNMYLLYNGIPFNEFKINVLRSQDDENNDTI